MVTVSTPATYDPGSSAQLGQSTSVGRPLDRVDGRVKVTGAAQYAADYVRGEKVLYGVFVGAAIAKGRVTHLDTLAAEMAPGVALVMTHRNAPKQAPFGAPVVENQMSRPRPVLFSDEVRHFDEPVALVVAKTFESARAAASLIVARYESHAGDFDLSANLGNAYRPQKVGPGFPPDSSVGDFEMAFADSKFRVDARYRNAYQHHNPMEPQCALANWQGDHLTLYIGQQQLASARRALAATLLLPVENVRLVSRYVGGGFGNRVTMRCEGVLAALAARVLGRPVKVAQTRQQMFSNTGHRPAFLQQVRLGADKDGRLRAISHETWGQTARFEEFAEQAAAFTRSLYAAPHRITRHRLVPLDLQNGEPMRAPGEASGSLALESAVDELAVSMKMDPVELRIINEPDSDPEKQIPFGSRRLVECMQDGARLFGWDRRPTRPRTRREGHAWLGYGMAAAIRPNKIAPSWARVRLGVDGRLTVQMDMTDIGTGSYTILGQIAADAFGVDPASVEVQLGDTDFPATIGSGGSMGAGSAGSALFDACVTLRKQVAQAAVLCDGLALHGANPTAAVFADGVVSIGGKSERLEGIAKRLPAEALTAMGSIAPGESYRLRSQFSYGAYFVEVSVDRDTHEIRLRRMLGVFDVGRVLNARTARSQLIGGMIWGVSAALHEEGIVDSRYGQVVNRDLASYHIPVNADIGAIDAFCLAGHDRDSNSLGSKGLGELGICGSGAAVANAVFNATGIRVRSFPITLDKIAEGAAASQQLGTEQRECSSARPPGIEINQESNDEQSTANQ